jgi:hypothetical protein
MGIVETNASREERRLESKKNFICRVILEEAMAIFVDFIDSMNSICWKNTPFP